MASSSSLLDFKASDLVKDEKIKERLRKRNYKVQYQKCLDSISTVNEHCHTQYTVYTVPYSIPGDPNFDVAECTLYLKEELRKSDFYAKLMKPGNLIYISWRPEDVEKVEKKNKKLQKREEKERKERREKRHLARMKETGNVGDTGYYTREPERDHVIQYDPNSALSNVRLRATLMKNNPKFSHLASIQKYHNRMS